MDWSIIGAVGELLGALAVVASLFYVAGQIKQNTAAIRSGALLGIASASREMALEPLRHEVLGRALTKAAGALADGVATAGAEYGLGRDEAITLYLYYRGALHLNESRFRQMLLGILDEGAFEQFGGNSVLYRIPVFTSFWPLLREDLAPDFARFLVERLPGSVETENRHLPQQEIQE